MCLDKVIFVYLQPLSIVDFGVGGEREMDEKVHEYVWKGFILECVLSRNKQLVYSHSRLGLASYTVA